MADSNTDPKAPPEIKEQTPTYGRKAQVVAMVLILIVLVGLVLQTYINVHNRSKRMAEKEAQDAARDAKGDSRPTYRIDDFPKAVAKAEGDTHDTTTTSNENRRKAMLAALDVGAGDTPGTDTKDDGAATVESVRHAYEIAELKAALAAGKGKIGHSSAAGSTPAESGNRLQLASAGTSSDSRPTAASSTLAEVQQRIKALKDGTSDIQQRKKQLLDRAATLGIALPPDVVARAQSGSGAVTDAAVTASSSAAAKGPAQSNDVFGELASNRAARNPKDAGPRPGEFMIPTGSVISAVLDMDIMSDYIGDFMGVLQLPVYDASLTHVLLPAGTKITGKTVRVTSVNEAIQNRMAITPMWIIRPDGKRIDFKRTSGMDSAGVSALQDQVDRHILAQVFGVGAYAIVGVEPSQSNYGAQPNSSQDAFIREATAQARKAGRSFAEKYLNIVPTQRIRAGTPLKIFVQDDIYVTPWSPVDVSHYNIVR